MLWGRQSMTDPFGTNTGSMSSVRSRPPESDSADPDPVTFNSGGVLTNIDNKPALTSQ